MDGLYTIKGLTCEKVNIWMYAIKSIICKKKKRKKGFFAARISRIALFRKAL